MACISNSRGKIVAEEKQKIKTFSPELSEEKMKHINKNWRKKLKMFWRKILLMNLNDLRICTRAEIAWKIFVTRLKRLVKLIWTSFVS